MKFKVGDKVRIRKDISTLSKDEYWTIFVMHQYANRTAAITEVVGDFPRPVYKLDIDEMYWYWVEELLTPSSPILVL